jgi:hypothetical protein
MVGIYRTPKFHSPKKNNSFIHSSSLIHKHEKQEINPDPINKSRLGRLCIVERSEGVRIYRSHLFSRESVVPFFLIERLHAPEYTVGKAPHQKKAVLLLPTCIYKTHHKIGVQTQEP